MRLLYITNGFPFPLTSGYLRQYHFIRELSARHRITLLSLTGRHFIPEHAEALAPFTARVATYAGGDGEGGRFWSALREVSAVIPVARRDPAIEALRSGVLESLRSERFDGVVFSGKRTFPAIADVRGVPLVIDLCDATSMRLLGRMRHCGPLRLPALWLEYLATRAVERRLLRMASHAVFASSRDRQALLGSSVERASVIPNGVDLDYWSRRSSSRGIEAIVMTGAMDYAPNRDAAHYLAEEVFPRVRREAPEARLLIVGRDPSPRLVQSGARPGVTVTGSVPDVRPFLEEAAVFVAPLRFGAGIQNKLLEAMAMEVPIVTSPLAADGLRTGTGDEPPLDVARNRDEFVERILNRLAEAKRDRSPNAEGRRFVERNFVWAKSAAQLERILESCAAGVA